MEIRGTFSELVLQSLDMSERDDAEPMQLFVEDTALVTCATPAILCNEAQRPVLRGLPRERFRYVLMLHQVRRVLDAWREGAGREPTSDEACRAVMYFSENDAHLAPGGATAGHAFAWRVGHRRGGD